MVGEKQSSAATEIPQSQRNTLHADWNYTAANDVDVCCFAQAIFLGHFESLRPIDTIKMAILGISYRHMNISTRSHIGPNYFE